ncbi:MAG: DMT family transporter [Rhodobacteraceae bacterium]|nr:DMT family transporter [Paracoccaceae bacterium]
MLTPVVILRNLAEMIGTMGFVTSLALMPLSLASAILQAAPLIVVLGAALILQEFVGWYRWMAILVGFVGVLLVIQPGTEGFNAYVVFAVIGVVGLGLRDLATRRVPTDISSQQLGFLGFLSLLPAGLLLWLITGHPVVNPSPQNWAMLGTSIILGVMAYFFIVLATRIGEVSFVTPFRYARIVFALIIGGLVFGEVPNTWMLLGIALIAGSGIFALWRERKQFAEA